MAKKIVAIAITTIMLFGIFGLAACDLGNDLAEYKAAGKAQIDTHVATKVEADYCADNWSALCNAVKVGKATVDDATTKSQVDTAVRTAKEAIDEVEKLEIDMNGVEDIRIDIETVKTQYDINEDLNLRGLVVKAKMKDQTYVILRNRDFEIDESAYDKSVAGIYRMRISFGEFKANFFVVNSLTLEEKEPWQGDIYAGSWTTRPPYETFLWSYSDEVFDITLDTSFSNETLTIDDFKMFDNLDQIELRTGYYRITIKNKGRDNVLETMRKMEALDFINRANPQSMGPRPETSGPR